MKPLTIELTKGDTRQFQSIGWKTPKADDCRRHFFALDQNGRPLIVMPKPAMPRYYVPGSSANFSGEPFPEAVCVEISPCRLLAPPCYQTQAELDGAFPSLPTFFPWQWVYWQTHKLFLILQPSDNGPLQKRLDKWLAAMRAAYERESTAWRDRIKHTETATLKELGFDTEEQRANRLRELQAQLDMVESENPIEGMPCKGRLKWTLEDIKRGHEGIRDTWMHEDWANKNGEDLGLMARERRFFRRWLENRTGTPANIFDATARQTRQGITPPSFGEKFENNPQFLEACAQVRYRARFADNANTVVYLADCELREELTAPELDELAKLKAVTQPVQAAESVNLRPSANYRQLFWIENGKDEQANLTRKQASAFSALHHAHGFILAREEWRQEIYGDAPPSDFRPDKIFAYRGGRKVWNRFIRVDGDRYRLVIGGE